VFVTTICTVPCRRANSDDPSAAYAAVTKAYQKATGAERCQRLSNDTLAKLQAAPHANCDAARQLPRLKIQSQEATCNCRDAVANESAEALQRRAKGSAACQLQLVVRRRLLTRLGQVTTDDAAEGRNYQE
jgi:hypothetical protein